MKLERHRVPPEGVGTLMYVGDAEATTTSIDILQVGVGAFAVGYALQSKKLGALGRTALALGGLLVARRGITTT